MQRAKFSPITNFESKNVLDGITCVLKKPLYSTSNTITSLLFPCVKANVFFSASQHLNSFLQLVSFLMSTETIYCKVCRKMTVTVSIWQAPFAQIPGWGSWYGITRILLRSLSTLRYDAFRENLIFLVIVIEIVIAVFKLVNSLFINITCAASLVSPREHPVFSPEIALLMVWYNVAFSRYFPKCWGHSTCLQL